MTRALALACALAGPAVGCDRILGIHELDPDASVPDAPPDAPRLPCRIPPLIDTPGFTSQIAEASGPDEMPETMTEWQGALSDGSLIEIIARAGGGPATPDWPEELGPNPAVALGGAADLDASAAILADLSSGSATTIYIATSGTLDVMQGGPIGATFAGNLALASFTHVDIAASGAATMDPDGCTTLVKFASFSAMIESTSP